MRTRNSIFRLAFLASVLFAEVAQSQNAGLPDADKATDLLVSADSVRELTAVIKLFESALEKGLDETNAASAKPLLASALLGRAEKLANTIFEKSPPPPQWPQVRIKALEDLNKATDLAPDGYEGFLLKAKLQSLPGGDAEKAKTAIEEVLRLCTDDSEVRSEAFALRAGIQPDVESRLADLTKALELTPEDAKLLRTRAALKLAAQQPAEALADFESALKVEPEDAPTHLAYGEILAMMQRPAEAKASIEKATALDPNDARAWLQLGRVEVMLGNAAAASDAAGKAIALEKDNLDALLLRASAYEQSGNLEGAVTDLEAIMAIRPNEPVLLQAHAGLLAGLDRVDEAIADLETILKASPDDVSTLLRLGVLHSGRKDVANAVKCFDQALATEPDNWQALRGRADARLGVGLHAEAIADYNRALELQPKDSQMLNNLAWVLATSPDDAIRDGKRSVELAKRACEETEYKAAHILSTLAASYAETGDFAQAIEWSRKACELGEASGLRPQLENELKSYQEGRPWREKQPEDTGPMSPPANEPNPTEPPATPKGTGAAAKSDATR